MRVGAVPQCLVVPPASPLNSAHAPSYPAPCLHGTSPFPPRSLTLPTCRGLPGSTPGLRDLAKLLLGVDMRGGGAGAHDSREDAAVSMRVGTTGGGSRGAGDRWGCRARSEGWPEGKGWRRGTQGRGIKGSVPLPVV